MKKMMIASIIFGLGTALLADANVPLDKKAMQAKMQSIAGETSPFNKHENFPKDYFLIPKNLPFSMGLVLHHPQSSTLNLTKAQLDKLVKVKSETVPKVTQMAKEIKDLELSLVKQITQDGKKASELDELVDTIAKKKAALTKAHLKCIETVRDTLTQEQREKVKAYVVGKKAAK